MRTRRQFQPSVDSLSVRIAPSSVAMLPGSGALAAHVAHVAGAMTTAGTGQIGVSSCSSTILAGPPPTAPPGTLPC
jgi:hypothetical protein